MKTDLSNFWKTFGYPDPVTEFRFHPERKWRFDFAWPDAKIAVEIEGGIFIGGGHSRPKWIVKDMEKYNAATLLGWKVFRFQPKEFNNGWVVEWLDQVFGVQRAIE